MIGKINCNVYCNCLFVTIQFEGSYNQMMFTRKFYGFSVTGITSAILCMIWVYIVDGGPLQELIYGIFFFGLFTVPIVFIYGLPVSILSDILTKKLNEKRRM